MAGVSAPENESAARVAFPSVPGGVGELDADRVDAIADRAHLVPDLLGDLDKAIRTWRQDPDLLYGAAARLGFPVSARPLLSDVVEERPDIDDGQIGVVADARSHRP